MRNTVRTAPAYMCWLGRIILSGFLIASLAAPAAAQERKRSKLWKVSVAVLAAASAADAASSWNRLEANPVLRGPDGRFGARGVAIKSGLMATAVIGQWYLMKKGQRIESTSAITNFGLAAMLGGVAARNMTNRPVPSYLAPR